MSKAWNKKEIEHEIKRLNIPKKFRTMLIDIDVLLSHDITMLLSIREDSGKTTQHLLLGQVLNYLYGVHIIYQRSDKSQTTVAKVSTLFDTIKKFGYIEIVTHGKYNDIVYKQQQKKFYYAKTTVDGDNVTTEIAEDYFCHIVSTEEWQQYKSSVNDPNADYMLYDEFMDTQRGTSRQMIDFMNNISTFLRPLDRTYDVMSKDGKTVVEKLPVGHVVMLGNNTNMYSFWFEEFCIEEDIANLKFGSYIDRKTQQGTTFACHLLAQSDEFKEKVKENKIHFFGFNTPKMSAFNGLQAWQSDAHQHLLYNDMIKDSKLIDNKSFIKHRNRYIRLDIYKHKDGQYFVFAHFNKVMPNMKKNCVFTLSPFDRNEFFGFGERSRYERVINRGHYLYDMIKANQIYFGTNSVGDLFQNYCTEYTKNKMYL